MISTSFASNSYSVGQQTRGKSKVLVGNNSIHFGMASSTGSKKEDKPTRIPETEAGLLSRIGSRLTQFFKDIANAFGHLFSWRSTKDEVQRSATEFFNRPEVKPFFSWIMREVNPKGEDLKQQEEELKAIEMRQPKIHKQDKRYQHLAEQHRKLAEELTPEGFAREMTNHFSEAYEEQLADEEAEKKQKAHSGSSIARDNCCGGSQD